MSARSTVENASRRLLRWVYNIRHISPVVSTYRNISWGYIYSESEHTWSLVLFTSPLSLVSPPCVRMPTYSNPSWCVCPLGPPCLHNPGIWELDTEFTLCKFVPTPTFELRMYSRLWNTPEVLDWDNKSQTWHLGHANICTICKQNETWSVGDLELPLKMTSRFITSKVQLALLFCLPLFVSIVQNEKDTFFFLFFSGISCKHFQSKCKLLGS